MKFSVIIPARDEEKCLGACCEAIRRAARPFPDDVEVIVVLNRCADATEEVARRYGAVIGREDARNLARVRNAGARLARGDILVTVDADSVMSENTLCEVDRALNSGRFVGGGTPIHTERTSAGILSAGLLFLVLLFPFGISAGCFWCRREDFEAIGGFRESMATAEDVDFARRLKAHGRKTGRRFGTLWKAHITTSCRKFDEFGDWFTVRLFLCHPVLSWRAFHGLDQDMGNRYWYDVER